MRRADLIVRSRQALCAIWGREYPEAQEEAEVVLNAIMPLITTVEELAAIPDGSFLADRDEVYRWRRVLSLLHAHRRDGYDHRPEDVLAQGPLTVVWTPGGVA